LESKDQLSPQKEVNKFLTNRDIFQMVVKITKGEVKILVSNKIYRVARDIWRAQLESRTWREWMTVA